MCLCVYMCMWVGVCVLVCVCACVCVCVCLCLCVCAAHLTMPVPSKAVQQDGHLSTPTNYGYDAPSRLQKWAIAGGLSYMSHVLHFKDSCHTCEHAASSLQERKSTCINESWHKNEWTCTHPHAHVQLKNIQRCDEHTYLHIQNEDVPVSEYGVATISRLLKILGLFCKRSL